MAITAQQKIPGIKTNNPPAVTTNGDEYVLAWTNEDGTISWTTLKVNHANDGYNRGPIRATGFLTTTGFGPSLTTFGGTVWMAYVENQSQAPFIQPYEQRRQPPVIMVSSLSGTTWSPAQPVWDPGLTGNELWNPAYQGPAAVTQAGFAASDTEMLLVWCEYATNGSDALAIVTDGVSSLPVPQIQVFYSKSSDGIHWSQRLAVHDALTQMSPAVVSLFGYVYMAWQGQSDNSIWFATYTDAGGWSATAKLPGYETSSAPALGVDNQANVQLAWKGESDTKIYGATFASGGVWSPQTPGKNWSSGTKFPVVATACQPALASPLSGSTESLLLAWKGAMGSDVYVVPLRAFAPAPVPGPGLGGHSNYIVDDHCRNLLGVSVTIEITQDMALKSNSAPLPGLPQAQGFGFQLNAYSPSSSPCATQQIIMQVWGNQLVGQINNWTPANTALTNQIVTVAPLETPNFLPKKYKLTTSLLYGSGGIITGAQFDVTDNHGNVLPAVQLQISGEAPQDLAPIVAFELDIVGPGSAESAVLSSGGGTISYHASSPLTVLAALPTRCVATTLFTAEKANTVYGALTVYPANPLVQSFSVAPANAPQIVRVGKTLPPAPVR
jgi:hypothetical protein